jgi:signal transduction histidine kinase
MRGVLGLLVQHWRAPHVGGDGEARRRREALAEAALALAGNRAEGSIKTALHVIVRAAAHVTGTAAALAVVDEAGRLEHLETDGADGYTRDTLAGHDLLGALARQARLLGRPVGLDDLDGVAGRALAALAPHGFLALPVGSGVRALLMLIEPEARSALDEDTVAVATVLAALAGETLASARRTAALHESCDELRHLATHVLACHDQEQTRTARSLHEGVCQRLAAANVQLHALEPLLDAEAAGARACMRDARTLVSQAIGELRELAQGLRPAVLEDFGFLHALRWYLDRLHDRTGVASRLDVDGDGDDARLPPEVESVLYRATEDALVAAGRWPTGLRVRYRRVPAAVQVEIAGSVPAAVDVAAIRERLRPFHGTVRVTTAPDAPALIAVEVPVVN